MPTRAALLRPLAEDERYGNQRQLTVPAPRRPKPIHRKRQGWQPRGHKGRGKQWSTTRRPTGSFRRAPSGKTGTAMNPPPPPLGDALDGKGELVDRPAVIPARILIEAPTIPVAESRIVCATARGHRQSRFRDRPIPEDPSPRRCGGVASVSSRVSCRSLCGGQGERDPRRSSRAAPSRAPRPWSVPASHDRDHKRRPWCRARKPRLRLDRDL